jgi:serine/threonine protein phosphatase 1
MKTYAFADLHGRFDLLERAIHAIGVDRQKNWEEPYKVVALGDYIDRGPGSSHIIIGLMELQANGYPITCLKGNHEDMMVETIRKPLHPNWWIGNGGGQTLISYGHPIHGAYDPTVVPKKHLDWLDALPLMHIDDHRVFVHAWIDSSVPLDRQKPDKVMSELYKPGAQYGHRLTGRHVIHGHHQFEDGPKLYKNRTNLDTFAWYTGRLVIAVFDDTQAGPIRFIEVIGKPYKREENVERA